jgi:membrane-bound serine protease (ClpP class)
LLILLSIGLFIAEIKIQGFGILGVGGIVSFVLGSVMLIDTPIPALKPSLSTILGVAAAFGAIFLFLTFKVIKAMKNRTVTGKEAMVGEIGKAKTDIDKNGGKVFVHGEWWNAITDTDQHIPNGSKIVVKSIENFVLTVSLADSV